MNSYIKAISYYLPPKVFSNADFFKIFPAEEEHVEKLLKTGVEERRIVEASVTASDMGIESAKLLFKEHSINPEEIDFLLFCAQEFDHYTPTTACIMQEKLGLPTHAGALDFNLGCSGFVYGLSIAKGLIESTGAKNVLLITSSTLTKTFHEKDKSSRYVFGDGAAATLVSSREEKNGIGSFVFGTDGKGAEKIIIKDGGARNVLTENSFIDHTDEYNNTTSDATFFMNGPAIFMFGLKTVPKLVDELLVKENKTKNDIDVFIFHQANEYLIESIRKKLEIPESKIFNYMRTTGNTVSSSIPIALSEAIKTGKVKKGNTLMLIAFGVGLSWAATTIKL